MYSNKDDEITIREQGELKYYQEQETPSGTGDTWITFTVPTGKKWEIKVVAPFNNVSGTINYIREYLYPYGGSEVIQLNDVSSSFVYTNLYTTKLTLSAGALLKIRYNLSAYTSGDVGCNILVQEFDA